MKNSLFTKFKIRMNKNEACFELCDVMLSATDVGNFKWMIDREYFANL